uniref:Uncharacterized protein n=1 Tax=Zea mays TaxID=4577 RepID=C0PMY4_MAIZE|nr:unknown [Zea mays]
MLHVGRGGATHSVVRVQHPRKILNTVGVGDKKSIALASHKATCTLLPRICSSSAPCMSERPNFDAKDWERNGCGIVVRCYRPCLAQLLLVKKAAYLKSR